MKSFYATSILLLFATVSTFHSAMGWGTDKIISPFAPSAQHSISAKQNGILFAAMPGAGSASQNQVSIFTSADNGVTWNPAAVSVTAGTGAVVKTKMLTTATDSIYCIYLQDLIIHFVNVESGTTGQLNVASYRDFDAAASANGNWIYVYAQEVTNNDIRRYGTVDGGITWTGNSALVTGNGASPKVCQWGTRLILNYYGPVLPDTATSVIRAAFYDETTPGTLQAGTFQDVALGTGVKRKQYQTVLVNGTAWFLFTEGDALQQVKCRITTDDGVTYQPEFVVSGNASVNAWWFGAAPYSNATGSGVTMTLLADSVVQTTSVFDEMHYLSSSTLSPSFMVLYPPPFKTYNDSTVNVIADVLPMVVNYNVAGQYETGIAWTGFTASGAALLFDRLSATTGLSNSPAPSPVSIYPVPAEDFIYISGDSHHMENVNIVLYDVTGKSVLTSVNSIGSGNNEIRIDISSLKAGTYLVSVNGDRSSRHRQLILVK
jgi:hypothetical protein